MLASKAAYAASLIEGGSDVVEAAARSDDPVVRVAAAAASAISRRPGLDRCCVGSPR